MMLISVVIPVYNSEAFLQRAVHSVTGQTHGNIELILVDDGSTDRSRERCDTFALADQRIKVLSQQNKGPACARNTGVRHASGEFICFLDADDYLDHRALEKLVSAYERTGADLMMSNFRKLENNGEIVHQDVCFSPENFPFSGREKILSRKDMQQYVRHFFKYPSNHLISYCWARLYKRSIIRAYDIYANERMKLFEDFAFNVDYLAHTQQVVFVNEPLYTYVMHNSHVSISMDIIRAAGLVNDMNQFRKKAKCFFMKTASSSEKNVDIDQEIGHTLIHYVIVFMVRTCRLLNSNNRKRIAAQIGQVIGSPIFRESLSQYRPTKGNSRIFPFLTKLKLVRLTMIYCRHKAFKRYGKMATD
ncbi:MAG: glycosyltransferase [Desulfatitalea sp.]|nr:glycosyltransferase [Desulfatitalea sp.]